MFLFYCSDMLGFQYKLLPFWGKNVVIPYFILNRYENFSHILPSFVIIVLILYVCIVNV